MVDQRKQKGLLDLIHFVQEQKTGPLKRRTIRTNSLPAVETLGSGIHDQREGSMPSRALLTSSIIWRLRAFSALWIPGVSISTICASSRLTMP